MRLSDLRGPTVVINFWATWCQPCRKEIPELVAAYNSYRQRGLVILGVNLEEGKGIVRPFAEDFGMNFPILIDRDGEVGDDYRILGLPTTYFVVDGVVVRVHPITHDRAREHGTFAVPRGRPRRKNSL